MKEVFEVIEEDYILLIDGDGTYLPSEAPALLEPVIKGKAEHVVGNRHGRMQGGALKRLNMVGNKMINSFFSTIYRVRLTDILSGYRAFSREGLRRLNFPPPALRSSRR